MKKIISTLLSLAIIIGTLPMLVMAESANGWNGTDVATSYAGGDGSASKPYLISNAKELAYFRNQVNELTDSKRANDFKDKYFMLTADIDLNGQEWTPIGLTANEGFNGNFDGNGKVVSNFKITNSTEIFNGFFGHIDECTVSNLGITNASINVSKGNAGVILSRGQGNFKNCYVENSTVVSIGGRACGFAGSIRKVSAYTNCYVAKVTATSSNVYPFLYGDYKSGVTVNYSPSVVNCFSDMLNSTAIPVASGNKIFGVYGATKDGIIAAMVKSGGYISDPETNDGYPTLKKNIGWDGVATEAYKGSGTDQDPYIIDTPEKLAKARDDINADYKNEGVSKSYFRLDADIDLNGKEWAPIGTDTSPYYYENNEYKQYPNEFTGTFDGNGHIIKNFTIKDTHYIKTDGVTMYKNANGTAEYTDGIKNGRYGFFGQVSGATVKKLGIEDAEIKGSYMAGLISRGYGTFEDCYVKNVSFVAKETYQNQGGFICDLRNASTFSNCYTYGCHFQTTENSRVGGFVGNVENANMNFKFNNCYTANNTSSAVSPYYAFINNVNRMTEEKAGTCVFTLNNAISADMDKEDVSAKAYNAEASKGETGKSQAYITEKLVTSEENCAYKTAATLNSAFPSLKWEKETQTERSDSYMVAAVSGTDKIKVTLVENAVVNNSTVYVAVYDGTGRFIGVSECPISEFNFTNGYTKEFDIDAGSAKVKVFVWDTQQSSLAKCFER